MARTRYMASVSRVMDFTSPPALLRARSSVSEMMPVSRQTAISWAAQAYISFSSSSQSSAMASLSMASTPVAREQNSSASQAVIFWSGAKVVALIPLTTPWVAKYSTSSLAQ